MKIVLTIAGTDPSGAAGIQADLQVIRDHGHFGVSAITAVLAQNTRGVQLVDAVDPVVLGAQLLSVFGDMEVTAVKIGLVPNDALVDVVLGALPDGPIVWDPVLASGDAGTSLYHGDVATLAQAVKRATLVTPNLGELAQLSGEVLETREAAAAAAAALSIAGAAVLLKAGHLPHDTHLVDILAVNGELHELRPLPAVVDDVRGTGCHLSTAIACELAQGTPLLTAVERARGYLNALLPSARRVGRGRAVIVRSSELLHP